MKEEWFAELERMVLVQQGGIPEGMKLLTLPNGQFLDRPFSLATGKQVESGMCWLQKLGPNGVEYQASIELQRGESEESVTEKFQTAIEGLDAFILEHSPVCKIISGRDHKVGDCSCLM
jgi:hypothetical protein